MAELKKSPFPPRMTYKYAYDVPSFLNESIQEARYTLVKVFLLVFIIVFLFLQD